MPYTVVDSFNKFLENISLSGDHLQTADKRHKHIVELLEDDFEILDSFPTGSIVRGTALKAHSDLDVFVVLHYGKHIKDHSAEKLLEDVRDQLSDYDAKIVKKNGQAVTLYFETWPNVDIVPASRTYNNGKIAFYKIPDMNTGNWIKTKPRLHDENIRTLLLDDRSRIRMAKTWNQEHSNLMQSYHLEVLALNAPAASSSAWPWDILQFFEHAKDNFKNLSHQSQNVDDYLDSDGRDKVQKRLDRATDLARDAWYSVDNNNNDEEAIRLYRILIGDKFPAYG